MTHHGFSKLLSDFNGLPARDGQKAQVSRIQTPYVGRSTPSGSAPSSRAGATRALWKTGTCTKVPRDDFVWTIVPRLGTNGRMSASPRPQPSRDALLLAAYAGVDGRTAERALRGMANRADVRPRLVKALADHPELTLTQPDNNGSAAPLKDCNSKRTRAA